MPRRLTPDQRKELEQLKSRLMLSDRAIQPARERVNQRITELQDNLVADERIAAENLAVAAQLLAQHLSRFRADRQRIIDLADEYGMTIKWGDIEPPKTA